MRTRLPEGKVPWDLISAAIGSDLPEEQIRRAVELGITKVNVATNLAGAYSSALREVVTANEGIIWPGLVFDAVRNAMKELVRARIRLFGSSGMGESL